MDYPIDVIRTARKTRAQFVGDDTNGALRPWGRLDEAIAGAILAERERVLQLVDLHVANESDRVCLKDEINGRR